jgi:hypothetical protein
MNSPARFAMRPYFDELAWGLGWKPDTWIAMLWHYLDESGEHGTGGKLTRLTLGGGIASCEAWAAFSAAWDVMLAEYDLPAFHMADFQAWKRPFDFKLPDGSRDWEKHRRLMNAALDIIIAHVDELIGFIAEPEAGKNAFDDAYETNIAKAVKEAAIDTRHSGQPVTMVFAKHNDFKPSRIGAFFDLWDDKDGRLKFGGVADPVGLPPLQVADIVAYELSRWARTNRPEENRYPLKRLKDAFRDKQKLKSGRFLLTLIP